LLPALPPVYLIKYNHARVTSKELERKEHNKVGTNHQIIFALCAFTLLIMLTKLNILVVLPFMRRRKKILKK
jgi:hypothetical protein